MLTGASQITKTTTTYCFFVIFYSLAKCTNIPLIVFKDVCTWTFYVVKCVPFQDIEMLNNFLPAASHRVLSLFSQMQRLIRVDL